jgi:hypothetical protein
LIRPSVWDLDKFRQVARRGGRLVVDMGSLHPTYAPRARVTLRPKARMQRLVRRELRQAASEGRPAPLPTVTVTVRDAADNQTTVDAELAPPGYFAPAAQSRAELLRFGLDDSGPRP